MTFSVAYIGGSPSGLPMLKHLSPAVFHYVFTSSFLNINAILCSLIFAEGVITNEITSD